MPKTLITITGLHKHYGARPIFEDAAVAIRDDHKIGVIGRNGAGKSTLCRLILGEEEADSGRMSMHADLRLSYLEQRDPFLPGETVLAFLMRYSGKEDWQCGKLAGRFMLKHDLLERVISGLSGGFQTRVKLAAMLLKDPNFLILDEPSNYLDLKTLMLLENFLSDFSGGFLIVSHDREFLKKTCVQTMEVENGRIALYPGNVEAYLGYKEEQRAQAEATNANVEIRRKQLQTFIDKNRAKASKATQAASKVKMLGRLQTIQIDQPLSSVNIIMPSVESRKGTALRLGDLSIGYPEKTVASGIDIEIERGQHVAVLGDNGQGKTTFLSTIAGSLKPKHGDIRWGHEIRVGYYAQHVYGAIDPSRTVMHYLQAAANSSGLASVPTQQILDMAGSFLFRGDDVEKKVAVLSGGERSRLCLAGLLLSRCPVLLLDEPTNHLDFETVEALATALGDYNGTVFFTSHDRTFVSMVATAIIEVRDGKVQLYPDDYESYVYRLAQEVRDDADGQKRPAATAAAGQASPQRRRERQEALTKSRNRLKQVERQVATLDTEKKELIAKLSDTSAAYSPEQGLRLETVMKTLDVAEAEWLELNQKIEELDAESAG